MEHSDPFFRYVLAYGHGPHPAPNLGSWVMCRLYNLWYTLTPLAYYLSDHLREWLYGPVSDSLRWGITYAKSLPGHLGLGSYLVAVAAFVRPEVKPPAGFRLHLIGATFAIMLVYFGFSWDGLGRNCLEPLSIIVILYTASAVSPNWAGWRWLLPLTAVEALSVRVIGIVAHPGFSSFDLTWETSSLGLLAAAATVAPALWYAFAGLQSVRSGAEASP